MVLRIMQGMLTLDELRALTDKGDIDTVLVCFTDLQGRLTGKRFTARFFADGAYDRLKLMDKASYLDFVVEIIRRSDDQKGFKVLPRR